jgi:hypothetical protein
MELLVSGKAIEFRVLQKKTCKYFVYHTETRRDGMSCCCWRVLPSLTLLVAFGLKCSSYVNLLFRHSYDQMSSLGIPAGCTKVNKQLVMGNGSFRRDPHWNLK